MQSTPVIPTPSVLQRAVDFIAGFETDPDQTGVSALLADLRATIATADAAAIATTAKLEAAKGVTQLLLQRIQRDARIAHYFDPLTKSYESLTYVHCMLWALDVKEFRTHYGQSLRFERPKCGGGDCARSN